MEDKIKNTEAMSEEELDQVAGGSTGENMELLSVMMNCNPTIAKEIGAALNPKGGIRGSQDDYIADVTDRMVDKYLKQYDLGVVVNDCDDGTSANRYFKGKQEVTHARFLEYVEAQLKGGWVIS